MPNPERHRADRNRRIVAGAVEVMLFGAVLWVVATGGPFDTAPAPTPRPTAAIPATDVHQPSPSPVASGPTSPPAPRQSVGFIGLPPESARPSTPKSGALVFSYVGRPSEGSRYRVWVYDDGRLIWQRAADLPEGANEHSTGYLEQRLTPEGVELLLSRAGPSLTALFGPAGRRGYPASWLPPSAWEERKIRAYVPTRYAVCYQRWPSTLSASRIFAMLPAPAADLLRSGYSEVTIEEVGLGFGGGCSELTTDDARALAEALEDGGIEPGGPGAPWRLVYQFRAPITGEVVIWFEPYLPHGDVACSACG